MPKVGVGVCIIKDNKVLLGNAKARTEKARGVFPEDILNSTNRGKSAL